MADFASWKIENLVAFAEAASTRLMEMEKRIQTERQLAYEWGYADGIEKAKKSAEDDNEQGNKYAMDSSRQEIAR
jgi:hypothetical protein